MQKEITVGEKTYVVRELLGIEADEIDFADKKGAVKKQIMFATGLSESDYLALTLKERLHILKAINEINGIEDFQKAAGDAAIASSTP